MSERKTARRDGDLNPYPVAAATKVEAGNIGAVNASGYLVHASDTAGLTVVGVIQETVDNSTGANGDLSANVMRGKSFHFDNDGTNALDQADVGGDCYVSDSETVQTDAAINDIVAGKLMSIEADGVYVYIG